MMSNQDKNDFFGKPIYIYTRAQALEDGELVDVTGMAKKAGFKIGPTLRSLR